MVGRILSITVTVALQVVVIPSKASVTLSTTALAPRLEQSKLVISVSKVRTPTPTLPLLTASSAIVTLPVASSGTIIF